MALSRCGIVLAAGLMFVGFRGLLAQSGNSQLTYDQMQAAKTKAQADQDKAAGTVAAPAPTPAAADTVTAAPSVVPDAAATAPEATPAVAGDSSAVGAAPADADKDPKAVAAAKPQFDKHGKLIKVKAKKEKPPVLVPVDIVSGELTVDGLIAKAHLNFQIIDLRYMYIWVPGLGTAVISNQPFAGAKLQVDAIDGNTMTVKADGHQLQLACDGNMLGREAGKKMFQGKKKDKPLSLYVALDTNYQKGSSYPEFGYGDQNKAPYNWPGTLVDLRANAKAPPLPDNLKQKNQTVKICPKNADGTPGVCHETDVPLVLTKK
jgi:hypothetical protein